MDQLVKTKLWAHQAQAIDDYFDQDQLLCAWEMGTGKTLFAIERDLHFRSSLPRRSSKFFKTLVVAPLSTHVQWAKTIRHETGLRAKIIDPKSRSTFLDPRFEYHIMHYEALRLMPKELKQYKFDHAVFDECHRLKNRNTKQTKAAKYLRIPLLTDMSGSPVTDRPQDIWSILNHLKPKDYTSYWRFFHTMTDSERPWGSNYWVTKGPSEKWLNHGLARIDPFYSRILADDCLDLPAISKVKMEVELPKSMRKAYEDMRKEMLAWVESFDGDEVPLPAPAIIAKMIRLQQFAMATIRYNPDTEKYRMEMPSPKIKAATDLIADNDTEHFVVFSQWRHPLVLLRQQLDKLRPSVTSVMFTGNETGALRERAKEEFITSKNDTRVMLATIDAGGEGVDGLQYACRNLIFLDRSWTPTKNDQAIARLRRGGQEHKVNVFDVVASNTIDQERHSKIELKKKWVLQTLGDI